MEGFCENCIEIITNPICPKCFMKQVNYWLIDLKANKFARKIIMDKIKEELSNETLNKTECIICKNEKVSLCSYCIFLKIVRILKEFNFDKQLTEDFQEIFDYHLDGEKISAIENKYH